MVEVGPDVVDEEVVVVPEFAAAWWVGDVALLVCRAEAVVPQAADNTATAPTIQNTLLDISISLAEQAFFSEGSCRRSVITSRSASAFRDFSG